MKRCYNIGERSSLANGQGLRFELPVDAESEVAGGVSETMPAFAIEFDRQVYAYRNHCPHLGIELDWAPGVFFDAEGKTLVCSTHGARFDPQTGHCLSGPCAGQSLSPVEVSEADGQLYIHPDRG